MIRALFLSFESLTDRRVALVMVKVILLTMLAFAVFGVAFWFGLDAVLGYLGWDDDAGASELAAIVLSLLVGVVLFRAVAIAITWIFADDIIEAVEARHYPYHAGLGRRPGIATSAAMALRSVVRVVGYNLLALPMYLLLLVTGIGPAIAFVAVNSLLLGRDLDDMLIARHGKSRGSMPTLHRLGLGVLGTAAMLIPFVNLLVPVLATAMAVHMVHSSREGTL